MDDFSSESSDSLTEDEIGELRFSRAQSYFDKSITIRLLIGGMFAIFLFFFLHFRETYVETLELGSKAKRYIVAQIDFAFPDEEATIILKQEAAHEIGVIWRIKEEQINQKATEFQKYITQNERGSKRWEELSKQNNFEDVAIVLSLFTDGLSLSRFTDIKTIQRIDTLPQEELPLPRPHFYPFLPSKDAVRLPLQFWSSFGKTVFMDQHIPPSISLFISSYFEPFLWDFEVDQGMEYTLRKLAQG